MPWRNDGLPGAERPVRSGSNVGRRSQRVADEPSIHSVVHRSETIGAPGRRLLLSRPLKVGGHPLEVFL